MTSIAFRCLALLFALSWLVFPGFGLIDLSVTWDPAWETVLEGGWGLFFSAVVGLAFLVVAASPHRSAPAVWQLWIAVGALTLAAAVSLEPPALVLAAMLAIETALMTRASVLRRWHVLVTAPSRPLLALTAIGAGPWLVYAWQMAARNREGRLDSDITNGVDHYSVQAALALALIALSLFAALFSEVRLLHGSVVTVCSIYLGVLAHAWPGMSGGFAEAWALAAIAWGGVIGVCALLPTMRLRRASVAPESAA